MTTSGRVSPGDPLTFPAKLRNDTLDTIDYVDAARRSERPELVRIPNDRGVVRVKNNSGADVPWHGVLGIDGPVFSPDDNLNEWQNRVTLKGITPATSAHLAKFIVLLGPLAAGKMGLGLVSGAVNMLVDIDAEWHGFADIESGSTARLKSRPYGGARILWANSGTGEQQATVLLGPPGGQTWWRGTMDDVLNEGSSELATLLGPGASVTVHDNYLASGDSIASGAKVGVHYDSAADTYYATEAVC